MNQQWMPQFKSTQKTSNTGKKKKKEHLTHSILTATSFYFLQIFMFIFPFLRPIMVAT